MRLQIGIVFLFFICLQFAIGQDIKICGTDYMMKKYLQKNSTYYDKNQALLNKQYSSNMNHCGDFWFIFYVMKISYINPV